MAGQVREVTQAEVVGGDEQPGQDGNDLYVYGARKRVCYIIKLWTLTSLTEPTQAEVVGGEQLGQDGDDLCGAGTRCACVLQL